MPSKNAKTGKQKSMRVNKYSSTVLSQATRTAQKSPGTHPTTPKSLGKNAR